MTRRLQRGFTLIELMVTVAIIAVMLAIAVPSFGTGVRAARERSVVQRMTQDFMWARGAAAANDASTLLAGTTGTPTLTFLVRADCSWQTSVNGTSDPSHSMTATALTATAPGASCAGLSGLTLPATFTFTPQGFVNTTGVLQFTGASNTVFPLQFLYSGSVFRAASAAS